MGVPCPLKITLQCSADKKVWEPFRAGLNGLGARGDFYWRAPMTYFMMSSFVKVMFLLIRKCPFVFSGSRECDYSNAHTVSCEK